LSYWWKKIESVIAEMRGLMAQIVAIIPVFMLARAASHRESMARFWIT
jgi:hypothetical protein